jgi:hypothetical protein
MGGEQTAAAPAASCELENEETGWREMVSALLDEDSMVHRPQ